MSMEDDTLVTGNQDEVANATPSEGVEQPKAETTPSQAVDASVTTGNAHQVNYEETIKRLSQDLNRMKSTFQRNEAVREKEWRERESQYRQQIEQLQLSTMDETQRKEYESTASQRKLVELQQRLQEVEGSRTEYEAMLKAQNYFLAKGVPVNALNLEEGYDNLWSSGMEYLTGELERLRQRSSATPPTSRPAEPPQAPPVVTTNNAPAYAGTTWSQLLKQYGDEETIYRLVETGQLPASIIPAIGKI